MRARARDAFAALVDAVVAPRPPLPPVAPAGAPAFFDRLLAASPRANAAGLVAALLALDAIALPLAGRRFRALDGDARRAVLDRIERSPLRPLVQALRGVAHLAYYGEDDAARVLGYHPDAVLDRATAARAARAVADAAAVPPTGDRAASGPSGAPPTGRPRP